MIELKIDHKPEQTTSSPDEHHEELIDTTDKARVVFQGNEQWNSARPRTLVVACSDGRLQKSIDEFLELELGVVDYDRLYAPGGPGLLGRGTSDLNTDQIQRELMFLMHAHRIEEIVMLFHGADRTGPDDSVCAHYKRLMPGATRKQIAHQQHTDATFAMRMVVKVAPSVKVHVYRAEVSADGSVHFVNLKRR